MAEPVNVLFIENSIGVSGSMLSLCTILAGLDRKFYQPYVVVSLKQQKDYLEQQNLAAADLRRIGPGRGAHYISNGRKTLSTIPVKLKIVQRICYWLLALGEFCLVIVPYTWRLFRYARGQRIRLIHHNNGFDVAAILLSRLLNVPIVAYQRGDEWDSFLVRKLCGSANKYIANSETTKKSLLSLGLDPSKIVTIYPAVTVNTNRSEDVSAPLLKEEFGVANSSPCFGIVGMLLPWKGQHVFLKAAKIVFDEIPSARAFVIGDTPDGQEAYRSELVKLCESLQISDRVVFTGFRSDVYRVMLLMDIIVHASVDPEPFGRVIAEAMILGKPVIAADAGGPKEIIRPGQTGFLVPPNNWQLLGQQIINVLKDETLAVNVGRAAAVEAKERFSLDAHIRRIQTVYSDVLPLDEHQLNVQLLKNSARHGECDRS
jgi:glycosyltransferase involved in cell wall biosynthesis